MTTIFTIVFVFIALLLGLIILLQQGKGEIGLGGAPSQGSQVIFGGSSGVGFFEKLTWVLGALFIAGSLFLSIYKTKHTTKSVLQDFKVEQKAKPTKKK